MRYISRHIEFDDYEDENDFDKDTYDLDNGIRYCSCGRRMSKTIKHEDIRGAWTPIEEWTCDYCD